MVAKMIKMCNMIGDVASEVFVMLILEVLMTIVMYLLLMLSLRI